MKVKNVIELLSKAYDENADLMIDWVDKEQMNGDDEMTDEIWSLSVARIEASESMIDLDYVQDVISKAQRDLEEEDNAR